MAKYLKNEKKLEEEVRQANEHVITCPCCGGNKLYKYPYNKTNVDMLFYCCGCNSEFWVSISPVVDNQIFKVGGDKK